MRDTRLLVLGGSWYVGHAIAAAATASGWEVTTFNRGTSGEDVPGVHTIRGNRNEAVDVTNLAARGPWDAVVDTSGYVPQNTLRVARALEPVVGRYVFMSTVSVYQDWPIKPLTDESPILYCPPEVGPDYGKDTEDGPTRYGYQKAGCESAALLTFGPERTTVLRPGVVLGPREYVGRLPWWLRRVAAGGRILAPGSPTRTIQPVDVRDLAAFTLRTIGDEISGTYNVTAPVEAATFGMLLAACADVTCSEPSFAWIPDSELLRHGVRQWSEMPLWRTFPGAWQVNATKAQEVGLRCRPLGDTVGDTWAWLLATGSTSIHGRATEIGMNRGKEQRILSELE